MTYISIGANGADNASSNGMLNCTLSKCLQKHSDYHVDAENMQVGCGGHIVNISCQCVKFSLITIQAHAKGSFKGYILWNGHC
jgi:hypothetical protein